MRNLNKLSFEQCYYQRVCSLEQVHNNIMETSKAEVSKWPHVDSCNRTYSMSLLDQSVLLGTNSSHAGSQVVNGNTHGAECGANIVDGDRFVNLDSNTISAHGGTNGSNNHESENFVP